VVPEKERGEIVMKIFKTTLIVCSAVNAATIVYDWCNGNQPHWYVWAMAVVFCIDVGFNALDDLIREMK